VTPAALLLGAVTAERIAELFLARHNTAALLAKGAFEVAPRHYQAIVLMHVLWLASLWILGVASNDQSELGSQSFCRSKFCALGL
jgi:methyltransferase